MEFNLNMQDWKSDGNGEVHSPAPGEFEVLIQTPFTLWCPTPLPKSFEFSFECRVMTPNSAMLLTTCAHDWRGGDLLQSAREGHYDAYNAGDLEMYTLGFNRTGQVANDVQPNASTVNLRRIGGSQFTKYRGLTLANQDADAMRSWHEWDCTSLICSVREFASGTKRFYSYRLRSTPPKISWWLEGEELFTAIDHRLPALEGGYLGLRCMTPGGRFRVRHLNLCAI